MPIFQETRNAVRQSIGRDTGYMVGTYAVTDATPALVRSIDLAYLHLYDPDATRARRAADTFSVTTGSPVLAELAELALQYAYESSDTQLRQHVGRKAGWMLGTYSVTSGTPALVRAQDLAYLHLHDPDSAAARRAAQSVGIGNASLTASDIQELGMQFAYESSDTQLRQHIGRKAGTMIGTYTVTSGTPAMVRAEDLAYLHLHDPESGAVRRAAQALGIVDGSLSPADIHELSMQFAYEADATTLRQAVGRKGGWLMGTFAVTNGTPAIIGSSHLAYTHLQREVSEAAKQAAANTFAIMDVTPTGVDISKLANLFAYESSETQLRQTIGRKTGWMVGTYTATNGSTTQVRANELSFRNADQPRGMDLYIYGGTGSGQTRTIISASAFTQGSGTTLYPGENFATAPDSTSTFELWRGGMDPVTINDRIADAKRAMLREVLADGLHVRTYEGGGTDQTRTIVSIGTFTQGTGILLHPQVNFSPAPSTNASFELWRGVRPDQIDSRITDAKRQLLKESLAGGVFVHVYEGGGSDQTRTIASIAAFTQGTGIILYPSRNCATAPSTNASFELWRGTDPAEINNRIADAKRQLLKESLAGGVFVHVYEDGGSDQTRTIASIAAFTQGTGIILYPTRNFATAPSTDASFELWRAVDPAEINNRIADAKRLLMRETLADGMHLYVYEGGGSGQARTVISASTFTQGTGIFLHPNQNFATAPSTNASFELWRKIRPVDVNSMINDAIRNAARRVLDHKEDYSIHLGDPLRHWGSFERWPDGASSAPDGWTFTGTGGSVAREASVIYSGRYSAAVTNGAKETAYLESDNIKGWPRFAGEVVSVSAKVYTTTASRVRLQLLDGLNTFNSGYHDGTNGWDGNSDSPLEIDSVTVSNALTQLRVRLTTDTGAAITVYWGKVWMEHDGKVYEFDLPISGATETAFAYVSEVWAESPTAPGEFNLRIPNEFWRLDGDSSTRRIIFTRGLVDQFHTPGRGVKLVGQRHARLPTADTDNLEVNPEYIRKQASVYLLDSLPWNDTDRSRRDRYAAEAERMLQDITTAVYPDAAFVEAQ